MSMGEKIGVEKFQGLKGKYLE